ncbi:MAG: hypothetical protein AAF725_09730 [Acidobacteriota bacterium]
MDSRFLTHIERSVADLPLPEAAKKGMRADLKDAALKGFVIDFEQLNADLRRQRS